MAHAPSHAGRLRAAKLDRPRLQRLARGAALCASLALSLAWMTACGELASEQPLRIVLVTLDTLRYDSFATRTLASDGDLVMPHLRKLADGGLVFERAYSATSTTQPTHASLLTGLHPWQHGVPRNGVVLDAAYETLAERLQARGFETAAVVASFPVHSSFGFDQGFDRFEDTFTEGARQRWNQFEVPQKRFYSQAVRVTDAALEQIDTARGDKQFFWFHYFDAHQPYGDSPGGDSLSLVDLKSELRRRGDGAPERIEAARRYYDRDVRYMDAALDRLLQRLLADARRFETHIIVTSDHGESFGEHGSVGHGERLTDEQIHVPLVLYSPRVQAGTSRVAVGSVDVAATIGALAGAGTLPGSGRDLTKLGASPASEEHERPVVGMRRTFARPFEDVRTDGHIEIVDGVQFYFVEGDREFRGDARAVESESGQPIDPDRRAHLAKLFANFELELAGRESTELLDQETQAALEALGYVR